MGNSFHTNYPRQSDAWSYTSNPASNPAQQFPDSFQELAALVYEYHSQLSTTVSFSNYNAAISSPQYDQQHFQVTADIVARQMSQQRSMTAKASTDVSFVINLSQDQAHVFLARAKR